MLQEHDMAKVTRVKLQPGEKCFGGKGFLIPFKIDKTKPQEPQVKPAPEQPTPQLPGIV